MKTKNLYKTFYWRCASEWVGLLRGARHKETQVKNVSLESHPSDNPFSRFKICSSSSADEEDEDLSPCRRLVRLRRIDLRDNALSYIGDLTGLEALEEIKLSGRNV
jgi:hypothetical protein